MLLTKVTRLLVFPQNGAVTDWGEVLAHDFSVPVGRPVGELAGELCVMLGSPDPGVRDDTAYPVLAVWTEL